MTEWYDNLSFALLLGGLLLGLAAGLIQNWQRERDNRNAVDRHRQKGAD